MTGTFVARDAELAALCNLCRTVERGGGPVAAIVHGDPGTGKTRLLSEVRAQVDPHEHLALVGFEPEQAVPLAAARSLLGRLAAEPSAGSPIQGLLSDPPGPAGPLELVRIFEATHRAVSSLGPTVLVVDDLQWVDRASIALCHYLFRAAEASAMPLALLAAGRSSPPSRSFAESLARVIRDPDRFAELELGPLDRASGVRLARELAPGIGQDEAEELWRRAGGSPFWVEILAAPGDAVPDVGQVVTRRLRAAGQDAESLLAFLAVAGRPVPVEDLPGLKEWPRKRTEWALAELARCGLAVESAGSVRMAHDLIREGAARDVPSEAVARIHRRVAVWLEERAGADERMLLEALDHRRQAGLPVSALALRLARSPRRRLLGTEGLSRLCGIADDADPQGADGLALQHEVAALAAELGEHEVAFERWAVLAGMPGSPSVRARSALASSESAFQLGRATDAWAFLVRARTAASGDPGLAIELDAHESAVLRWLEHRPFEAREAATRAVQAARRAVADGGGLEAANEGLRAVYLRALAAASDAALVADDPAQMLALSEEMAAAAGSDARAHVQSQRSAALALRFVGRNRDAEATLRRAWDEANRHVLPQATLEIGSTLGIVMLSLGRLDEAEAVVRECLLVHRRLAGFGPARVFGAVLVPLLDLSRGPWRPAVERLRLAAEAEDDPHPRSLMHVDRASAVAWLDPRRGAGSVRSTVASALSDVERAGCLRCLAEVTARSAEALARIGDANEARELLGRRKARPGPSDARVGLMRRRAEVAVAVSEGGSAEAIPRLEEAVEDAERFGLLLEAVHCRIDLGVALAPRDRERASDELRRAGRTAEQMGALTEAGVAEKALRSLGIRTWRRGPAARRGGPLDALTAREREVARLVAAGATNPEISAELFLPGRPWSVTSRTCSPSSPCATEPSWPRRWGARPRRPLEPEGAPG